MVNMRKWLPIIGWTLLAVSVYYLLEVLFNTVFRPILQTATTKEQYTQYVLIANISMKAVTLIVFAFWYKVREHKWHFCPDYRRVFGVKTMAKLVALALLLQYAIGFCMTFVRFFAPAFFAEYDKLTEALSLQNGPPFVMFFLVVILGPIAEEVLFRGVIYGKLREGFTVTQAAVISAAIFGIYHKNIVQGIYSALVGIVLAYVFEKTGTILGASLLHMLFNMSAYVVIWINHLLRQSGIPAMFYFAFDLACIVVVVLLLVSMRGDTNRYDKIYLDLS